MAYSANQEQVFSLLDQSGVSNFALGERKIKKKNALCFDQSAFSNFALYVINAITGCFVVMKSFTLEVQDKLKLLSSTFLRCCLLCCLATLTFESVDEMK